jgi:two-component system, LytTR family, sensor kinase
VSARRANRPRPLTAPGWPFAACVTRRAAPSSKVTAMTEIHTGVRGSRWVWIAASWCVAGLFDASQTVMIAHVEGRHHSWLPLFGVELVSWLPWALATPLVIALARRRPMAPRNLAVHLAAFAAISAVAEGWSAWLQVLFDPWGHRKWPTFLDTWWTTLLYQVFTFLIAYALILTVTYLVDARERISRQITETARLNEELSRAQLAALRRQMEPHFMYNTLHSIAGLVRDQRNDAAVSMIVGLSEFLRRASEDSHRSQVTLAEEVEYLQRYLELQQVRFGERLQVSVEIPAELLRARVPNLLIQPLVENAIKHGIAKRAAGGIVRVTGTCHDGNLRLSIYNDAPALLADWQGAHTGVGLANLRTRLQILHGNGSGLQLTRVGAGGVEVVVTLPLTEA